MGESLFKGLKVNGSLYTGKIEGVKINDKVEQGFFMNGNYYEPGPFECVLEINSSISGPVLKVYLKETVSSITYYVNGTEYTKSASSAGGVVYLYVSDGLSNGATFKIYDGARTLYLKHTYTSTDSKGNTTTHNTRSISSIIRYGQYMTSLPDTFISLWDTPRPINIPCNFTNFELNNQVYWNSTLGGQYPHTIPISLSEYSFVEDDSISYGISMESYSMNWQRPDDPNNKCTKLTASFIESQAANYMHYKVYLIPITLTEFVYDETDTSSNSAYYFYPLISVDEGVTYTPPTVCVFWDRNGYIKGDPTKPVKNFSRIIEPFRTVEGKVYVIPTLKYWGEWGKSTLSSLGYNMSLLAYPELLPD